MITFAYSDNSEAVAKSLESFAEAIADQRPALREIADDFREVAARQFATEGRAEGTPWPARHHPSLPSSLRRGSAKGGVVKSRTGQGGASPLLQRTGALRDSLSRKGAVGHVEEFDDQALAVGSRLPYAGFHQLGTRRMPARPLIVLSDSSTARWTEIVQRAIEQKAIVLGTNELK